MRALVVDDHVLFADVIRATLERLGFEQIQVVTRADEAMEAVRAHPADLVLVDLGLPDRNGLDLGREISEALPEAKIVVLTALEDQRTVQKALRAGFHGYLTKSSPVAHFASSIRSVLGGQAVFPSGSRNGRRGAPGRDVALLSEQLTDRERDVLTLLVQGASGAAIAEELGISRNTVRTHVQSILTKLQVHSRLEAATFAVRYQIVDGSRARRAG